MNFIKTDKLFNFGAVLSISCYLVFIIFTCLWRYFNVDIYSIRGLNSFMGVLFFSCIILLPIQLIISLYLARGKQYFWAVLGLILIIIFTYFIYEIGGYM